jgi:hypothetical protein
MNAKGAVLVPILLLVAGCASRSVTPDTNEVKLSRESPPSACQEMGRLTGTSTSRKATHEDLLADLKQDAARKGANYVRVDEYSSLGTSVTGTAYTCP